jgi:hypothetical protein
MTPRGRVPWARALLVFAIPGALAGQDSDLDQVERLIAEGRFASARLGLQDWIDTTEPEASWTERQRGIWLRALLTIDPGMAEQDFRRLVVEYPAGPFSDRALLRLAQGAHARAEASRALSYLQALIRDYPSSPYATDARALISQIEEARPDP